MLQQVGGMNNMSETVDTQGWNHNSVTILNKANNGNAQAQYQLGLRYLKGKLVPDNDIPEDHDLAIGWLKRSAQNGSEDAEYLLGTCYENGVGVTRDLTQAVKYYERSARAANRYAQYALGEFWAYSNKYDQALPWYTKSARQEYAPAQLALGKCLLNGLGCDRDDRTGLDWVERSAHKNHKPALEFLKTLGKTIR